MQPSDEEMARRFWPKVDQSGGPQACWIWTSSVDTHGYGHLRLGSRTVLAHRVAAWHAGLIPSLAPLGPGHHHRKAHVLHSCDNPRCVNPRHLSVGTNAENQREAALRDRSGWAKVTNAQAAEIRARYAAGGVMQKELAAEYGIVQSSVSDIIRGVKHKYADVAQQRERR